MKNKGRLIFLLIMLINMITLTGCQLALPDSNTQISADKLCGVFLTIGDQEFPINDEQLAASVDSIPSSAEALFEHSTFAPINEHRFEGKLTAEQNDMLFDGLEGYFMGVISDSTVNDEPCYGLVCSPDLTNAKLAVNVTETSKENSGEATLYVSEEFKDLCYLNPVYITSEGSYYVVMGNSHCTSFSGSTTGSVYSLTIDTKTTKTHNNSTEANKDTFKINIAVVDEIQKVTIKEMDQNDNLVKTTDFDNESPEEYIVTDDTSYVIVEEMYTNASKENVIKRSIYTPLPKDSSESSNLHFCNFLGENEVVIRKMIKFVSK